MPNGNPLACNRTGDSTRLVAGTPVKVGFILFFFIELGGLIASALLLAAEIEVG